MGRAGAPIIEILRDADQFDRFHLTGFWGATGGGLSAHRAVMRLLLRLDIGSLHHFRPLGTVADKDLFEIRGAAFERRAANLVDARAERWVDESRSPC